MILSISFSQVLLALSFAIRHWSLIKSFLSFPKLPVDWTNKEQVRVFIIALATSAVANELTKLAQTMWTEKLRYSIAALARNKGLWDTAWGIVASAESDGEKIVAPKTLRERIRSRLSASAPTASVFDVESDISEMEDLVDAIQLVKLTFKKTRNC